MSQQNKVKKHLKQKVKARPSTGSRIARNIGGALGNLVGLKSLGADAGSWLARVTGMGDYTLHQNSFMRSSTGVPSFEYQSDGSVIITHREYITPLKGSQAFETTSFDICPTNNKLMPWLAIESLGYDQYEFLGLLFAYVPSSGDAIASTNNALGTLTMSTEYDVSRTVFGSKQEMAEYMFTTSEKPSEHQLHPVECNPKRDTVNARYLGSIFRTAPASQASASSNSTIADNLRCLGRLTVATEGQQAVTTIGDLWCTYKVKLSKPRIPPNGFPHGILHLTTNDIYIENGDYAFGHCLATNDSTMFSNGIRVVDNTIAFGSTPPGTIVKIEYLTQSIAGSSPTFTPTSLDLTNMEAARMMWVGPNVWHTFESGGGTSQYCRIAYYLITGYNATFVFGNPTIGGSGAHFKVDVSITTLPDPNPHGPLSVITGADAVAELRYASNRLAERLEKLECDEKSYHVFEPEKPFTSPRLR